MAAAYGGPSIAVGVADHAGWAVLMTTDADGRVLDRRRVELIDGGLPKLPHHHEAQHLPVEAAIKLIETVRRSAETRAAACLDALTADLAESITAISLRRCPPLPDTIAERISDYRAQCVSDTVMYRQALADAATTRGWRVACYDAKTVFASAAEALGRPTIDDLLAATRAAMGPPWQKDHRMAMAAAIAALA